LSESRIYADETDDTDKGWIFNAMGEKEYEELSEPQILLVIGLTQILCKKEF